MDRIGTFDLDFAIKLENSQPKVMNFFSHDWETKFLSVLITKIDNIGHSMSYKHFWYFQIPN